VPAESAGVQPYDDFDVADTIGATDWQNALTKQRVLSVVGTVDDATGQVDWTVETADTGTTATPPTVESYTTQFVGGGNATIAIPSGTVEGDLLVMMATGFRTTGSPTPYPGVSGTPDGDWTIEISTTYSPVSFEYRSLRVWWKVADAGDEAGTAQDIHNPDDTQWILARISNAAATGTATATTANDTGSPSSVNETMALTSAGNYAWWVYAEDGADAVVEGDVDVTGGTIAAFFNSPSGERMFLVCGLGTTGDDPADVTVAVTDAAGGPVNRQGLGIMELEVSP
jgi:hypothetical protein